MSNFEMKKKAVELIKRYFGTEVKVKNIVLLEGDSDGKYIYFGINGSNMTYAYRCKFYNAFVMFPNWDGLNGIELPWIEE